MMSSSLLYHKNYLYTADRQIVLIYQLDTLDIYFREKVCVFLSL